MIRVSFTYQDLATLLYILDHTPYQERPSPAGIRRLTAAFERWDGDLSEFNTLIARRTATPRPLLARRKPDV